MTERTIELHVPTLSRVEGEGAMHVTVRDGVLEQNASSLLQGPVVGLDQ